MHIKGRRRRRRLSRWPRRAPGWGTTTTTSICLGAGTSDRAQRARPALLQRLSLIRTNDPCVIALRKRLASIPPPPPSHPNVFLPLPLRRPFLPLPPCSVPEFVWLVLFAPTALSGFCLRRDGLRRSRRRPSAGSGAAAAIPPWKRAFAQHSACAEPAGSLALAVELASPCGFLAWSLGEGKGRGVEIQNNPRLPSQLLSFPPKPLRLLSVLQFEA